MADTSDEKERLTNTEFAELIPHLPLQDLLLIEFRIDDWKLLIDAKDSAKNIYGCAVCGVIQCGVKNVYAHIDGKKHKSKMQCVKQFYHPEYTYGKSETKMAVGTNYKNSEIINTSSCKKATNVNRPNLQIIPLAKNVSNVPIESGNSIASNFKNQLTSQVSKNKASIGNTSVVNRSDLTNRKDDSSQLPSPILKKCENITHSCVSDDSLEKTSNTKCNHSETDKLSKMVKNPFAIMSKVEGNVLTLLEDTSDKSCGAATEVIIIEDEIDEKNRNAKRANSEEINQTSPKRQKMSLNPELRETVTESDSIADKSENENTTKPRYQSNIVIVPTVDKNSKVSNSQMKPQPKFATKTFNSKLSNDDVVGLIGVEYVIKILKDHNDLYPKYECGLCEIVLDGAGMQEHLIGYNHRLKFCEKHFPTAIRQYRQYMGKLPEHEVYKVMAPILEQLAIAIEQYHGRDLPYECLERDVNINRHEILSAVFSCRHASDQYGPAFTHVVDSKEVDRLIESRHNYKRSEVSKEIMFNLNSPSRLAKNNPRQHHSPGMYEGPPSHRMYDCGQSRKSYYKFPDINYAPVDDETHKLMVDDFLRENKRKRSNADRCAGHSTSRSRSATRNFEISRSQTRSVHSYEENDRKSLSPLRENDVWQAYRHMVDQKVNDLNEVFRVYRNDPERHPLYNEEWEMFWKRRKEELMAAGLDHRTYNYQPEWVRYFNARIEELYCQSLENVKIESRERLCLPMVNNYLTNPKYHVHMDKHTTSKNNTPNIETEEKPEIVSVLRIMTALEEHLGSLGPKIIELLSKALQTEKTHPKNVNEIILTSENCSLLETAMEKFKGLVIAGLLDGAKDRALKKAIEGVESLLSHYKAESKNLISGNPSKPFDINLFGKRKSHEIKETTLSQNKAISGILGQGVKRELAVKLAAVLNAQGKTDIDPQQLQQILAVYMLIEKKKQEANTSTAGLGSELLSSPNQKALTETLADLMNSSSNVQKTPSHRSRTDCTQNKSSTTSMYSNNVQNYGGNFDFERCAKNSETSVQSSNMTFRRIEQPSYSMQQNNSNESSFNMNAYNSNHLNIEYSENFPTNASGNYVNNTSSSSGGIKDATMNTSSLNQLRTNSNIPNSQRLYNGLYGREYNTCPPNQHLNWTSDCGRSANKWP